MCPAHFHLALVMYWTMSVTLVLCLMMELQVSVNGMNSPLLELLAERLVLFPSLQIFACLVGWFICFCLFLIISLSHPLVACFPLFRFSSVCLFVVVFRPLSSCGCLCLPLLPTPPPPHFNLPLPLRLLSVCLCLAVVIYVFSSTAGLLSYSCQKRKCVFGALSMIVSGQIKVHANNTTCITQFFTASRQQACQTSTRLTDFNPSDSEPSLDKHCLCSKNCTVSGLN